MMSWDVTSTFHQRNLNEVKSNSEKIYEFEDFRLDVAHLMLYRKGQTIALKPKVIETLVALIERRGELVSKNELMNLLWADSFVEESNLTQNIYLLRKTLGERENGQPFIETFRRRGYRFNGRITTGSSAASENNLPVPVAELAERVSDNISPTSIANERQKRWYFLAGVGAAFGLLILTAFGVARFFSSNLQNEQTQTAAAPPSSLKIVRITPDLHISASTLTPDGNHLAYTLFEKGKQSLWLKDLATGSATQILPPIDEGYLSPLFSSDGKTLFYASNRKDAPNGTILRVSLDNGREQKITSDIITNFTLSPDEKQLASINSQGQLLIAQTDGGGERVLAARDRKKAWYEAWGAQMSWSPDGERIALCGSRLDKEGQAKPELIEVSAIDGTETLIPIPDWNYLDDAVWLRDQSGLLVVARETETAPFQIWRVGYPDGAATRITNDSNSYDDIVLSGDERFLKAHQRFENLNLWTVSLDNSTSAKQITFGNAASDGYFGIAFAQDGKIIYTSPRDGKVDLWMMNADGSEQKQLTKNAGDYNGRPNVSPDGSFIVFTSTRTGAKQIWRMDIDGGNPKQLTDAEPFAEQPDLSPDGASVFYTLNEGETSSIWKIPSDGGEPGSVSQNIHAWSPYVSPDGKFIAYQLYDKDAVQPWKSGVMSAATGEPLKTFDTFCFRHLTSWTADSKSLIYIPGEAGNLWQLPIDGGKPSQLTSFETGRIFNFAVSPDYKLIAVSRGNPSTEAVLITNFLP